ncbi:uncharacterized protein [Apostichopus japonicus]|uniref:uncharacterized protein n=1 Tax=Stichopus japonicus TaxID=307972 RepID=UPI003AB6E2AA
MEVNSGVSVDPKGGRPLLYGPTKESSRRVSQRRKDATKIFLLQCYVDWQLEKDLHQLSRNLKQMSNADFVEHLIADHAKRCKPNEDKQDAAMQTTNEGIRSVGTQTEEVQATSTTEATTSTPAKKAPTKNWPVSAINPPTFQSQKDSVKRNTMTAFQDKNFEDDDFHEEENQFEDWARAVQELNQSEIPIDQLNAMSLLKQTYLDIVTVIMRARKTQQQQSKMKLILICRILQSHL